MMKTAAALLFCALALTLANAPFVPVAAQQGAASPPRSQGPCDIYAAAQAPCVAAHSTTRALYAAYNGPLYQVMRQSDGEKRDIGVVRDGGYADAAAQDEFCANTTCFISLIYDQSEMKNHLIQAPRGAFSGPAMGGANNLPIADAAPVTLMGHKVYGVYIAPGMGMRLNEPKGTAVDDQAQGQYWVINGLHYNSGCCFDYGNAEIDSKDDGNGTMETTYFGNSTGWFHGAPPGPWVMTDQENNLVGCVNPGSTSKLCPNLPTVTWRFVTAMAKGKPRVWASLGGDAQKGPLQVMFDGPRVNVTYDPMRKQGAILLGNGGDNSISSQGTFYEGAMTAANTYPSHETDQLIQANVVAARYDLPSLTVASAVSGEKPTSVQTFAPGATQDTVVTFVNTTGAPVSGLTLSLALPNGWRASAQGAATAGTVAPGASVKATFRVTSSAAAFNGDMVANAAYTANGAARTDRAVQKLRNVPAVKINEFRIGDGAANATNSFIELYNAGGTPVDLSNWSLTQHQTQQTFFSDIKLPAGTRLAPRGFYVLALSTSGLAAPSRAGDSVIHVRGVDGLKVGDTIRVGDETRKIAGLGTAAGVDTTVWQPAESPMLTIPAGATNVPVASIDGFKVGEKIALGYGATYPTASNVMEKVEVATVTAIGKPGTQAFLGTDAPAGATNISVTSVENITVGDRIRLDIESIGHGVETVTVNAVGTPAIWLALAADAPIGTSKLRLRRGTGVFNGAVANAGPGVAGLAVGRKLVVGMPDKLETVTVTAINGDMIDVTPALKKNHLSAEPAVEPGTGLDLVAPLKFMHAGNLPFSNQGTGISFTPAAQFAHSANEPVQPLGTGVTLDSPLAADHAINAPVQNTAATTAGYRGPTPNQYFGGPALSPNAGAMILRNANGLVVDSLNYGLIVDPWASEGYHTVSGTGEGGCRAISPGVYRAGRAASVLTNSSAGRFPDGADADSNCLDFQTQAATVLLQPAQAGAFNIKVAAVTGFAVGQSVTIDPGPNAETFVLASVGAAGASQSTAATASGAVLIPVASSTGFVAGQTIIIDDGATQETAVIVNATGGRGPGNVTVTAPLRFAHGAGVTVVGAGLTLSKPLTRAHANGAQIASDLPTPGAANKYAARR